MPTDQPTTRPHLLRTVAGKLQQHPRRWPVAAVAALALVVVGVVALSDATTVEQEDPIAVEVLDGVATVTWLYPATPLWDAGVRPGDHVLTVDDGPIDPLRPRQQVRQAQQIEVLSATSGAIITAEHQDPRTLRAPLNRVGFMLTAGSFAAVGILVYLLSRELRPALALLTFASEAALLLLASLATPFGVPWALALVLLSMIGFGFTTLSLFLMFPVDQSGQRLASWVLKGAAAASLAVAALYVYSVHRPMMYPLVLRSMLGVVSAELLLAVAAVVNAWRTGRFQRPGITLVLLGLAGGIAPFVFLSALPFLVIGTALLPPEVTIVTIILIPLTFGALMLRGQLPGIERPIRRSAVAFLVWAVLLMLFAGGISLLEDALPAGLRTALTSVGPVLLVAVVAATFPGMQRRVRTTLERRLFHDVYDFAPTVQALTAELNRLRGVPALALATLDTLVETLDLTWACLIVQERSEHLQWRYTRGPEALPEQESDDQLVDAAAQCVRLITQEHVEVGMLLIGPKRHDLDLQLDDKYLVETTGSVLAPVLRNAVLLAELAKQVEVLARREQELASLNLRSMRVSEEERRRLAADLHDEPLQRAILLLREMSDHGQPHREEHAPIESMIARWSEAVQDIVVSLRAICAGLRPQSLDDFGLAVALETLVASMRARAEKIEILYDPPTNLLDVRFPQDIEVAVYRAAQEGISNSLKHAASQTIRVSLERCADGIELVVADDGPAREGEGKETTADGGSGGYGLIGIRERLAPWQGTVNLEYAPDCTVLRVFVPVALVHLKEA